MSEQEERCLFCGSVNLTFNSSMDIVCEDCGKMQPDLIEKGTPTNTNVQKVENNFEITLTSKTNFFRKKGSRCPNCGSTNEMLEVVGNNRIQLYCSDCIAVKGKDDFREWNIEKGGDTL